MFHKHCIQRGIGNMSPAEFKEKMLRNYYSNVPTMSAETLKNVLVEHRNENGNPPVTHSPIFVYGPKWYQKIAKYDPILPVRFLLQNFDLDSFERVLTLPACNVLSADLEGAGHRYLLSSRTDSGIAIHDLYATVPETIGPITRDVFPTTLYIKPREEQGNKPVNKVEWYPGDYGHFSSSSNVDNVVKIWDPNKGQIMEKFKFEGDFVEDHCSSPHQPLIAVARGGEIRLIDLRTGHTGHKFERPKASLDRLSQCCRQPVRPPTTLRSSVDPSSSGQRFKGPTVSHEIKKHHSHALSPRTGDPSATEASQQASSFNLPMALEIERRQVPRSRIVREFKATYGPDRVSCVRFHPAVPSALTAGYYDGSVVMWDVRSSRSYLFDLMDHFREDESESVEGLPPRWASGTREVAGLRYSSDGQYLISFSRQRVLLWDGHTGESLAHQAPYDISSFLEPPDPHYVGDVQISTASKRVFVSVGSGMVSFDLQTGTAISQFSGHLRPILGVVIDHGQHRLFTYGRDASFITWSFREKDLLSKAKKSQASSDKCVARFIKSEREPPSSGDEWTSDEESD